ncbi:MAG: hypothetical protein GY856_41280 [bacterium]|nr:hypothetical protein [bacterium]
MKARRLLLVLTALALVTASTSALPIPTLLMDVQQQEAPELAVDESPDGATVANPTPAAAPVLTEYNPWDCYDCLADCMDAFAACLDDCYAQHAGDPEARMECMDDCRADKYSCRAGCGGVCV